ncbi:MAG: hypothetical protein ABIQ17_01135 [Candidatus Limnocylindrales bacterium]
MAGAGEHPRARATLPVLEPDGRPGVRISRSADRRIAFAGLSVAAAFLALAVLSLLLPAALRLGAWLPVHLALAGAAATAIAALLPFFSGAMAAAPPARPVVRILGIVFVAGGAATATASLSLDIGGGILAASAALLFVVGIGFVAAAIFLPLRGAFGQRRGLLERAYGMAMVNVAAGVTIVILHLGGNVAVATAWGNLKPAHAWLNLIGFAGLVIVATVTHLAPTVVGTRLRPRTSSRLAVVGVSVGSPLIALGYVLGLDPMTRLGALVVLLGAAGILAHAAVVHFDRARGQWTTDLAWHRFTATALLAGQGWLALGFAIAATRVLLIGPTPAAWSLPLVSGPLVIGGVAQILLGAMSHLLPAIGPGDLAAHAQQRRLLGRGATLRLVGLNLGALLVTLGSGSDARPGDPPLVAIGLALAAASAALTLAMLIQARRASKLGRVALRAGLS